MTNDGASHKTSPAPGLNNEDDHSRQLLWERLRNIIDNLGPKDVYRSIYDHRGNLLVAGYHPARDELVQDFSKVDFRDKSVVDFGCNFGYFSFLAEKLGARKVLGVDNHPDIIEGCRILAALYESHATEFMVDNIENLQQVADTFDIVMLIDYLGRFSIRKGKIPLILGVLESLARTELLFIVRPVYHIRNELRSEPAELAKLYPPRYIQDEYIEVLSFIEDFLAPRWSVRRISAMPKYYQREKKVVHFTRKSI
ncbi:MAG: class I SAM-dependent methyltransferase [Deltaproteobacteria bacterium]|nr:class I SAM-dependent methyltransferase [Deltaproteobacteria bacterium]MBW2071374.1 class I SAM-dependent methyltransferase [Deltaproteobacteria bacterium]